MFPCNLVNKVVYSLRQIKFPPKLIFPFIRQFNFPPIPPKFLPGKISYPKVFGNSWTCPILELHTAFTQPLHCVKSVRIRSYSGSYFPAFGLNTKRYGVSLCIQSECEKIRTRITPNTDNFHAVLITGFTR